MLGLVAAVGGSAFTLGLAGRWNRHRLAVKLVALLGLAGIWHISLLADLNDHLHRLGKPLAGSAGPLGAFGYGLVIVGVLLYAFTPFDRWRARQS